MRRFIVFILPLLLTTTLSAQKISVKDFKMVPNDLTARVKAPVTDQNGDKCALIKVITDQKGFVWEGDMLGIVETDYKIGEHWLYVPYGAKYLTIRHEKLGALRNYKYPMAIKKATVYEMVLTTAKITTIIEEPVIGNQWLTINTQPEGATVFLNGEMQSQLTPFFKKVKTGEYTYRIELAKYHNTAGKIDVTADKKAQVDLQLKPAFGSIKVNSTPETGATVMLNGSPTGKITPCTLEEIESGSHKIRLMKSMYKPIQQDVTVNDGQTTPVTVMLASNFAKVNIETWPYAEIFIDEESVNNYEWSGRVSAGVHTIAAKKDKHKTDETTLELSAGDKEEITLKPTPKEGTLEVISRPMGAKIDIELIDGNFFDRVDLGINMKKTDCNTTPCTIQNLLIDKYKVTLSKKGYGTITQTITIKENETTTINETLPDGKEITIASDPGGAELYINGTKVGTTPHTAALGFGSHKLKLVNGKKTVEEVINVTQGGKTKWQFSVAENLVDKRDGKVYKIVTIGKQVWMAENLNYKTSSGSWCYDNKSRNCDQYGRLYNWETAKKVCPDGWHLPSRNEFETLLDNVGRNSKKRYKALKKGGSSGFSALFGGFRSDDGKFYYLGSGGGYWSSSEYGSNEAWYLYVGSYGETAYVDIDYEGVGRSVRCLQN